MRKILKLALVIFIFTLNINFVQAQNVDRKLFNKLKGVWLNEKYIFNLSKTKSPIYAAKGLYHVEMDFFERGGSYYWQSVYNFHEGIDSKITKLEKLKTGFEMTLDIEDNISPLKRQLMDFDDFTSPTKIKYTTDKKNLVFSKINCNEALTCVNRIILSGTYIDRRQRKYYFSDSMIAKWPNKSFKYRINIDPVFNKDDFIGLINKKSNNIEGYYIFTWENDTLLFYNAVVTGEVIKKKGEPIVELKKLNSHSRLD